MTVPPRLWWLPLLISPCLVQAQAGIDAVVQPLRFHLPGQGEQVDVNIAVLGNTARWVANDRGFQQAHVEALTMVEQGNTIVDYRKTRIDGPERTDTLHSDFVHQEHFVLQPGEYTLSVELQDPASGDSSVARYQAPLVIPANTDGVSLSDIALTASPSAGQNAAAPVPYTGHYYPQEVSDLGFYAEAYNTPTVFGTDSLLAVNYQIETYETHEVKGSYRVVKRLHAEPVVQLSGDFQIGDLPSGNYVLAVEVMGRDGKVLTRREQFIQRNNPLSYDQLAAARMDLGTTFASAYTDPDTLADHLRSLRPIAGELERKIIDDRWKDRDLEVMQRFLYTFWYNRNAFDPKAEWERYRAAVIIANKLYGCRNLRGYDSDMGYVFLKYGPPNTVTDRSNDTGVLPYQIWHFYRVGKYTNKRFVFWQPEMSTTCWQLLHSDVPGEMKDYKWVERIQSHTVPSTSGNSLGRETLNGEKMLDNFDHPR